MAKLTIENPAETFYVEALHCLERTEIPFMIGGAYALREYADIYRDTKDLDIFCTQGDYPRLLAALGEAGYEIEVTDAAWLAKAFQGDHFVDLIFGSANLLAPVDSTWFEHAHKAKLLDCDVLLIPPEELLWQKMMLQERNRFDGADVNHILRKQAPTLDWKRLLMRMEATWEVLLAALTMFRFVYPSERDAIPRWVLDELLSRFQSHLEVPTPRDKICRGPLIAKLQYQIDVEEWGYRRR